MSELDSIYLDLLRVGFVVLKQALASGDPSWVYAEVEMLHNVPSLVGEQNRERHQYYWHQERSHYIAWMAAHGSDEARSRMRTFYEPIWSELAKLHQTVSSERGSSTCCRERAMTDDPRLLTQVRQHPYPLIFATISGAHLYGFPSPDSDYDLRGVHVLPLEEVVGLRPGRETIEHAGVHDGLEIDLVTHDVGKFFGLLLKKNGYVLEQVLSPLVVHTTPEHAELREIARKCVTRHHAHHYLGFAETQWRLFRMEHPPRVKPLLYVYRVLLTGRPPDADRGGRSEPRAAQRRGPDAAH